MTCASARPFFCLAQLPRYMSDRPWPTMFTLLALPVVWRMPFRHFKKTRARLLFLFCQKASIGRREAQLSCQNYLGACRHHAARRPANSKDHFGRTGGATPARNRQQSCQRLDLCVSRRAFLDCCFSIWDEHNIVCSFQLPCIWPICSRSRDHVMIHHL